MNPTETAEMLEIIARAEGAGLTILLIEHKLDLVMRLSDRVDRDGRRREDRRRAAGARSRADPAVIEAYLGPREVGARRSEEAAA